MNRHHCDVIVVGAGVVGSVLGYALALRGLRVGMIDARGAVVRSVRTSAITNASCRWLQTLGLWPASDVAAAPLRALRIRDQDGRGQLTFDSAEIGCAALGVVVAHDSLEDHLRSRARTLPGIQWLTEPATQLAVNDDAVHVVTASGHTLVASLVVAADGGRSVIREQLGVPGWSRHYGQHAVVADIALGRPHDDVAWQRFRHTGPIALLPFAGPQQASLIWSTETADAQRLLALSDEAFDAALLAAFGDNLGTLHVRTTRQAFPLVSAHAQRYTGARFALIGDAAHQIHPLAGQGVNLGLADARELCAVLSGASHGTDLGEARLLRRYERARKGANIAMLFATDTLNRVFHHRSRPSRQLLAVGLNLTDTLGPLKALFMRVAGS